MLKRGQESNLKEGSAVAKPKPMNLNLTSNDVFPTKEQSDVQASNTGKQERRDESSNSTRSWKQSGRGQSLQEAFQNLQTSDSGYLEKVFKNRQKQTLAENAPPMGIEARKTNVLIWWIFYLGINEGSAYGTRLH